MRTKFEAVDKNDKLHKRASVSRVYSHCVAIWRFVTSMTASCMYPRSRGCSVFTR